jgi:hypothetical protein
MISTPQYELSENERRLLDEVDIDRIWHEEILPYLSPSERLPWRVTDKWGNTILKWKTLAEAKQDCIDRNRRAEKLGVKMTYRVDKSEEWAGHTE